jgi:hypothetical protein
MQKKAGRPPNRLKPGEPLQAVYVLKSDKKRIERIKKQRNYQSNSEVIRELLDKPEPEVWG